MIKIYALVRETFLEALSKKVFVVFLVVSTAGLLVLLAYCSSAGFQEQIQHLQPTADDPLGVALREKLRSLQSGISFAFFNAALILAIIITSDLVPTMMSKGVIDLLLSKPLSRVMLLAGKVLGGLLVVIVLILYFMLGSWLIISIATGVWTTGYMASFVPLIVTFIGLYGVLVFVGIQSRSAVSGMVICFLIVYTVSPLLFSREELLFQAVTSDFWRTVIDVVYYITPQVADMAQITSNIVQEKTVTNTFPYYNALVYGVVFFVSSAWSFAHKEF
ncbi:MAG: ABC transporter permease subunit [Bacteroidota bacterium]|nr:ABC transporter permease [Candidatus Kapabacteria bacterium]MDW8219972.1 ABC transporter permease subunit [Bacteroidota bacterium]